MPGTIAPAWQRRLLMLHIWRKLFLDFVNAQRVMSNEGRGITNCGRLLGVRPARRLRAMLEYLILPLWEALGFALSERRRLSLAVLVVSILIFVAMGLFGTSR